MNHDDKLEFLLSEFETAAIDRDHQLHHSVDESDTEKALARYEAARKALVEHVRAGEAA